MENEYYCREDAVNIKSMIFDILSTLLVQATDIDNISFLNNSNGVIIEVADVVNDV